MFKPYHAVMIALAVLALYSPLAARAAWVRAKIAALSSPPSLVFADINATVPSKGARPRLVLIGDSRISRWSTDALAGRWEILNRGIGGETAAQLAARFQSDAIALDPDVIVIEAGINDLVAASHLDAPSRQSIVQQTVDTLRGLAHRAAESGCHVLLATIIPPARPEIWRLPVWNESVRDLVAEANTRLRRSQLPARTGVIDFSAALADAGDRWIPDAYRFDTLHLNAAGYQRLTVLLGPVLDDHSTRRQPL